MPRKAGQIAAALTAKGFDKTDNDHTWFVYRTLDGRATRARTKLSHGSGSKDISDSLLSQMARQVKLSKPEFDRLLDCPLSRDEYEQVLAGKGET